MDYTFTPPGARLKRNTIYWLAIRRENDGFGSLPCSSPVEVTEIDSGWQIQNEVWYRDRSGLWTQRDGTFWFTVSGSCAGEPTQVECGDFPASSKTPGLVRLGEYSMGRLADEDDHNWLQIEGIRNNQRYRVEVDFLGDDATGGGFTIHTSALGLPPVHRSDLWETNYDGHAVLDFESAIAGRQQFYLHIESDNFLNRSGPEHRFIGDYIVTINELNGMSRGGPAGRRRGSALEGSRRWTLGRPTVHRLWNALTIMVCLWIALACGVDADDRLARRYAGCMADANTALHRLNSSGAVGTVPLSAAAVEERVRDQPERGRSPWRRSGPTTPATANRCGRELRKWRGQQALGLGRNPVSKASLRG